MSSTILSCIYFYSFLHNIDPQITQAVVRVESNGNPFAISRDRKDMGLMQIRKKFHKFSTIQLLQPCTNIKLGVEILSRAKTACKKCVDIEWVNAYNLGIVGAKRLKHPRKFKYYRKIAAALGDK